MERQRHELCSFPDNLGLLIGQKNSHRYGTGLDYEFNQWRVGLGFSVDQAIDSFGGQDYRYRVGGGYQQAEHWSVDFTYMYEQYAEKSAYISGTTVVEVQNQGSILSPGLQYFFK